MPPAKRPSEPRVEGDVEVPGVAGSDRAAREIARLRAEVEAQRRFIQRQAASLQHSRKLFERAATAARIGVWECSLPDEHLTWTSQVYDIFDMPRGATLDRARTLGLYTEESRLALQALRARAIEERGGFTLDAEIVTAHGRQRWIRVTATVESENGVAMRIFGMKQDITAEKLLADRTRYLAEFDILTGLPNRGSFQAELEAAGEDDGARPLAALMLVDLDGFKQINDRFGHATGDACLKLAATRLLGVCGVGDRVCRIGGDEFAIFVAVRQEEGYVERLAEAIVAGLRRPMDIGGPGFAIGASVGIARPDGGGPSDLFQQADTALYAAKAAGRNTFRAFSRHAAATHPPGHARAGCAI